MSEIRTLPKKEDVQDRLDPGTDRVVALPNAAPPRQRRRYGGALFGGGALLLLVGGLGIGGWRHYQADLAVAATAQQIRTIVPEVRVAAVRASDSNITVTLPATTTAFEAANIFARTSGYIEKRYVDIGDRVKAGDLLAQIVAPELDHQIAQAKATLAQNQATLQQTQASRDLADVTNARDSKLVQQGWLTLQQATTIASPCRPSKPRWGWLSPTSPPSRPRFACSGRRRTTSVWWRRSTVSSRSATSTTAAW